MTQDKRSRFTVITNNELDITKIPPTPDVKNAEYHTNPMYEKLVKFKLEQKQKRFTVDDLLKW